MKQTASHHKETSFLHFVQNDYSMIKETKCLYRAGLLTTAEETLSGPPQTFNWVELDQVMV